MHAMLRYYNICDNPEELSDIELGVKLWHLKKIREMENTQSKRSVFDMM
jgi:hypothetical protein